VGFLAEEAEAAQLSRPVGCPRCKGGYTGRFALLETMPLNEDIQRLIIEGKSALDLKNAAIRDHGMISLRRAGILNALRGATSVEEVLRVTMPDEIMPDGSTLRRVAAEEE
jgi:type IV pilus assembly protein PilB